MNNADDDADLNLQLPPITNDGLFKALKRVGPVEERLRVWGLGYGDVEEQDLRALKRSLKRADILIRDISRLKIDGPGMKHDTKQRYEAEATATLVERKRLVHERIALLSQK